MSDLIITDPQVLTDTGAPLKRRFHDNGDGTWSETVYAGGGSSGAATIADGADVTQGAIADAVVAAGAAGTLSAKLRRLTTDVGALAALISSGNLSVKEAFAPGYEDNTNNVAKVEQRFTPTLVTSDTLVKTGAGFLHTLTFSPNDAAPTAGSIIVYDNTAESGTQLFNVTFTTTWFAPFTVTIDGTFATGLYIGFTTTNDVNVTASYR